MNKRLILFCFCLTSSVLAFCQNTTSVVAGINFNDVRFGKMPPGYGAAKVDGSVGMHAGFSRTSKVGRQTELSFGLQYSQKGSKGLFFEEKIVLRYLELPFFFTWRPVQRFSFDAGPSIAYNLSAHTKWNGKKNWFDAKKIDAAVNAGASFMLSDAFSIYGRYSYGLIAFDYLTVRDDLNVIYHKTPFYNKTIQFGLRYTFNSEK